MQDNFEIEHLNESNFVDALDPFFIAMNFNDEETQNFLINSVKLFYDYNRFISLGLRDSSSKEFIGFGSLITLEDRAWIPYFGINPQFQRRGFGKTLMNELISIVKKNGWETIELCATSAGYPLYKSMNFNTNYSVNMYKIIDIKQDPEMDLQIQFEIPEWIYKYDKEVIDEDRRSILNIHSYDGLKIITEKDKGYGILYGSRIGPVIADTTDIAKEILLTAYKHGAKSFLLVEDSKKKEKIKEIFKFEAIPNMQITKMTYGIPVNQKLDKIFCLRSFAYG